MERESGRDEEPHLTGPEGSGQDCKPAPLGDGIKREQLHPPGDEEPTLYSPPGLDEAFEDCRIREEESPKDPQPEGTVALWDIIESLTPESIAEMMREIENLCRMPWPDGEPNEPSQ